MGVTDKAQKEINEQLAKIMRATAIKTFNKIVQAAPVDTGRFRQNWAATVNTPDFSVVTKDSSIRQQIGITKITDVLYLTNNLPYAQKLEEGSSQQRPSGWVRTIVLDAQKDLNEAARGTK